MSPIENGEISPEQLTKKLKIRLEVGQALDLLALVSKTDIKSGNLMPWTMVRLAKKQPELKSLNFS